MHFSDVVKIEGRIRILGTHDACTTLSLHHRTERRQLLEGAKLCTGIHLLWLETHPRKFNEVIK